MIIINTVGLDDLARSTKRWGKALEKGSGRVRVLLNRIGRGLRDRSRKRITTQGDGSWEPLGAWVQAKTGRRKALITERPRIKYRVSHGSVDIYHDSPSTRWSLNDHARGYTNPADKSPKFIPLKYPGKLAPGGNLSKRGIFLPKGNKATKVPKRNVWGSEPEARREVINPEVQKWLREVFRK